MPGSAFFLELPRFRDEVVGDADNLPLCDRLARRGRVIDALVQPHVEDFEGLVGIVGLPELPVVLDQVRCRYHHILRVQVA